MVGAPGHELTDYGAQQIKAAAVHAYSAEVEAELARTPLVQAAIRGVSEDLVSAGANSAEIVRQRARSTAGAFVTLFP